MYKDIIFFIQDTIEIEIQCLVLHLVAEIFLRDLGRC